MAKYRIRLLVVDDHPVVRAGLRTLLAAQHDMEVVGEADDGSAGVTRALELKPDVVIMDITMTGMDGLAATREIRRLVPESRVLVLTMHDSVEYLRQMLEAGATGYVLKKAANMELAVAIRAVHRGEVYLYPSFTRVLLGDVAQEPDSLVDVQPESHEPLSLRETQVLRLIAQGYTSRQMAEQLFLSTRTIETYRARLMEKLNVKSRVALVRYALRHGLLGQGMGDAEVKG
jgi:two-component system response regulator NreC